MTKNELKYYASLNKKKIRENESLFLVEGKRIVEEGINSSFDVEIVFYTDEFFVNNPSLITKYKLSKIRIEKLDQPSFSRITDTKNPQGIAAVFRKVNSAVMNFSKDNFVIALENISDPGNLGTILRTCSWFGFNKIIISSDSVDLYNPKVLRSSMGAIFNLNIIQTKKFYTVLNELNQNGFFIITTAMSGENVFEYKPADKTILVFCNEANGASTQLQKMSTEKLAIPKIGDGESLNVASAAAVILSQISKR